MQEGSGTQVRAIREGKDTSENHGGTKQGGKQGKVVKLQTTQGEMRLSK